jgi:hypothetical protein
MEWGRRFRLPPQYQVAPRLPPSTYFPLPVEQTCFVGQTPWSARDPLVAPPYPRLLPST